MEKRENFKQVWTHAYLNDLPLAWIANELGRTEKGVASQASRLRRDGVHLPYLKRGRRQEHRDEGLFSKLMKRLWG